MAKIIIEDDFGNRSEYQVKDMIFKRNSMSAIAYAWITKGCDQHKPCTKERSDFVDAIHNQAFDQWYIMRVFSCECGKEVLFKGAKEIKGETMCPDCYTRELRRELTRMQNRRRDNA